MGVGFSNESKTNGRGSSLVPGGASSGGEWFKTARGLGQKGSKLCAYAE